MKKSYVFSLKKTAGKIADFFRTVGDDRVTVFAAQASYFIIISSVPFLILILGLTKYFVDTDWLISVVEQRISGNLGDLINTVIGEVTGKGNIPLLSVTILTTLWTSSRGVSSVTRGIGDIYGIKYHESFFVDLIRSLIYTVLFILIIVTSIFVLMFADTIKNAVGDGYPFFTSVVRIIKKCSNIGFILLLTLFFAFLFSAVSKKGKRTAKKHYDYMSDRIPRGFRYQLPGAAFAAVGWVLFSYFYSLYLAYFPTGYYIYGSLAAALLLMLWLYTCMNILLFGAEINKFIFRYRLSKERT